MSSFLLSQPLGFPAMNFRLQAHIWLQIISIPFSSLLQPPCLHWLLAPIATCLCCWLNPLLQLLAPSALGGLGRGMLWLQCEGNFKKCIRQQLQGSQSEGGEKQAVLF